MVDFSHYDDAVRAKRVYRAYLAEASSAGLNERLKQIVEECSDPDRLDVRLDLLVTGARLSRAGSRSTWIRGDVDSDGWYSNARSSLDD